MSKNERYSQLLGLLLLGNLQAGDVFGEEHTIDQRDMQFSEAEIRVKVGDRIHFVNKDSYFHNVYSLSRTKTFDLGSYPKNESRSVEFDEPGEVDVNCAIHPNMKLKVVVEE